MSRRDGPIPVGNLFICKHDMEGETVNLTDSEIQKVLIQAFHTLYPDMKVRQLLWMEY